MSPARATPAPRRGASPAGRTVRPESLPRILEERRGGRGSAVILFVGEYRFPAHGFDPSPFDRALEMLRGTEGETHAFFSHDAEGDGFDERALFADLVAAPLFAPARAIAVRRAERLCKFAGRTRKQGERTEFEAASLRFLEGERDGSLLLVSLPTKTEKDPLAADLLGKGGIVVVCPGPEGEEANGFALASALVEGKSPQALRILETIRRDGLALAPGRRERDPRALYAILFARMYESARRAAEVRRLLDGGVPIREAAASVGSKGWPGSDLDLAARARNPAGHERLLRALRALEVAVKSGREPDALAAIGRLAAAFGGGAG